MTDHRRVSCRMKRHHMLHRWGKNGFVAGSDSARGCSLMIRNTQLPRSATDTWQISGPENESWYRSSVKASIGLTPRMTSLALSPRFHIQHYSEPLTTLAISRPRRFGRKQLAHRSDQSRVSRSRPLNLHPAPTPIQSRRETLESSASRL